METMFGVLRKAQSVEEKAASIYSAAATRFAADLHWSRLFGRLAEEEKQHALRIQMLSSRLSHDRQSMRDARLPEVDLDALLAAGDALLDRIASPRDLSLPEALSMIGGMEESFASVHAHMLLATDEPGFNQLFVQLAAQDRAHREMLSGEETKTKA